MNAPDYIIVAAAVLSAVIGLMRGFLREAIALATWIVALFVAWHFSGALEPYLGGALADAHVRPWAARAIVLVLLLLLGTATGHVLGHFVRLSIFNSTDRLLGLLFGLLRAGVVLGFFVMLGQTVKLTGESWWKDSVLIPYGESVASGLRSLLGEQRLQRARGEHVDV